MTKYVCKLRRLLILVALIASVLLLSSCSEQELATLRLEDAGLDITHITSGVIDADTQIAVRYQDEQITSEHLNQELPIDLFRFTPQIEGTTYWEDTRTLVFKPTEPLYERQHYHGALDYSRVLPEIAQDIDGVEFHFETLGQRLMAAD